MKQVIPFLVLVGWVGVPYTAANKTHILQNGANSLCGGSEWIQYQEDRCFILVQTFVNRDVAEQTCNGLDATTVPTLATIRNPQEMAFIISIMPDSVMDNIWIGAERKDVAGSNDFIWTKDGSDVVYSNWMPGRPIVDDKANCVQLNSGYARTAEVANDGFQSPSKGQWIDVVCGKRNLILCEKEPTISLPDLHRIVLDVTRNPVPIGFIYTQLPGIPQPQQIWPQVQWKDISENYPGLFFRVVGENAAGFGVTQAQDAPRVTRMESKTLVGYHEWGVDVPIGWSNYITTGRSHGTGDYKNTRLATSNAEVRPRNTAIKIWQRID